jgi:predicted nucleic acid-binding protein
MTPCVLDASVVARWWLASASDPLVAPALAFLNALRRGALEVHAPDLLLPEVANAFWKAARFGDWPPASAEDATLGLVELPIRTHGTRDLLSGAVSLSLMHGISVYDACYVTLSRREALPLYTADRRMVDRLRPTFPELHFLGGA